MVHGDGVNGADDPHENVPKAHKGVTYKHHRLVERSVLIEQELTGKSQKGTEATTATNKR